MPSGEGAELAYFKGCADHDSDSKRVAYLNGSATCWWLRSPGCNVSAKRALVVGSDGDGGDTSCSYSYGIRPTLIMPSTTLVDESGNVIG